MFEYIAGRFGSGSFEGETLWIGNLGHFFIVFSFVMAGLATFAFAMAEWKRKDAIHNNWLKLARTAFYFHGFSVFAIFGLMFYMIFNHYFEYHYVWKHSSLDLPLKYIVSCFWEGQEGSFLLWQFWHVVLGLILIRTAKKFEAPVMGVVSITQFLLASMVLGVFIFGYKIGVNPFTLLRNEMGDAPIFSRSNYLDFIADGNGLNPLLQNYWMVIHPPILFLGFAATVVPFAFAIASMVRSEYDAWVKPALPWTLFAAGILGTGIFMGGAWAYESLSFGGFWAWDPVENASFVPWLTLVAGVHTMVAYRYTKRGLGITYFFFVITFILILYSTFLTRSGVLGDTSVHAFTDLGMTGQLLIYLFALLIPSLILIAYQLNKMPKQETEEAFWSREFWMFIGSLIFLISAILIIWDTSLPVTNKIFGTNLSIGNNVQEHYNKFQLIVGILLSLGAASIQFLAYKRGQFSKYVKWLGATFVLALLVTIFIGKAFDFALFIDYKLAGITVAFFSTYWLLILTSFFAVFSNILYIFFIQRKEVLKWGGSLSHIGFGIFLVGILISQHKQEVISINNAGIDFGKGFDNEQKRENILLISGDTVMMADYEVSYKGREAEGVNEYFTVQYTKRNEIGEVIERFDLLPNAQMNPNMGLVSNPDTKHYLTKDVFTHITSVPEKPEPMAFTSLEMGIGDTFFTSKHYVILDSFVANPEGQANPDVLSLGAAMSIHGFDNTNKEIMPLYLINITDNSTESVAEEDLATAITVVLESFNPQTEKASIKYKDEAGNEDFIILKAIVFPYINLLWWGGIIMLFGFFFSSIRRTFKL